VSIIRIGWTGPAEKGLSAVAILNNAHFFKRDQSLLHHLVYDRQEPLYFLGVIYNLNDYGKILGEP
jgi:hypothetical protein